MITVTWLDPDERIVHWQFKGTWTTDETLASFEDYQALVLDDGGPYKVMIDFTASDRIPSRLLGIFPKMAGILSNMPERATQIGVVAERGLLSTLARIFGQTYGRRMTLYTSFDEAMTAMRGEDTFDK